MRIDLTSPATLPEPRGYSHVAGIPPGSRLVWTAGQVPLAADGSLAPGEWEGQTRQVMENIGAALEAGGASWDDVFKSPGGDPPEAGFRRLTARPLGNGAVDPRQPLSSPVG